MGMTCGLDLAGFCRVTMLLVCVRAEVSPSAPSKRKVLAGCVHQYCYCRERRYYPYEDVHDFAYLIQIKDNAPALLRQALSRTPVDLIMTGDYQPADCMPRPIIPGDKRTLNKRIVEALANQVYYMDLQGEAGHRI